MNDNELREMILLWAGQSGIDLVRFTHAGPFSLTAEELAQRSAEGTFFVNPKKIGRMCTPQKVLPGARSIIACALNYRDSDTFVPVPAGKGWIAPFTRKNNYLELKTRMQALADSIRTIEPDARFYIQSCYGKLAEKEAAMRAGVGWYGKNGVLINERFGSWFVIGLMVTDLKIEPDHPVENRCRALDCDLCIQACPSGALTPFRVNMGHCLQYLSERVCEISGNIRATWGNRFYGCSDCLLACPFNRETEPGKGHETGVIPHPVDPEWFLGIKSDEFSEIFGNNQVGMRELEAIRRNARLVIKSLR